jgi:hypothetical protein
MLGLFQAKSTADNNCAGCMIEITIPRDLNGDLTVDIYDAIILAGHFNQHYP